MLQRVTEELNKLIPLSNEDDQVQQLLHSVRKKNRNIFEVLARGIANFYSEFFKRLIERKKKLNTNYNQSGKHPKVELSQEHNQDRQLFRGKL